MTDKHPPAPHDRLTLLTCGDEFYSRMEKSSAFANHSFDLWARDNWPEIRKALLSETEPQHDLVRPLRYLLDSTAPDGQWADQAVHSFVKTLLKNAAPQARGKTVDSQESAAGEPGKPAEMAATPNTADAGDIEWLHRFLNCTVFGPPPSEIQRAHRIVDALCERHGG